MVKRDGRLVKWFWFQMYECSRVENFITEMAKKGWMLEKFKGCKFTFQACDPIDLKFSVEVFDESAESDFKNAATLTYIDYCEKAGWNYVAGHEKIHIFYTKDSNVVPIETDDEITLRIIHKNVLKKNIYLWFIVPFMAIWYMKVSARDFNYFITNYISIALVLTWTVMLLCSLNGIINYAIWYVKTRNKIKNGESLKYYDGKNRSIFMVFSRIFIFEILLILLISILLKANYIVLIYILLIVAFLIVPINLSTRNGIKKQTKMFFITLTVLGILFIILTTVMVITDEEFRNKNEVIVSFEDDGLSFSMISHDEVPVTLEDYGIIFDENESVIRQSNVYVDATVFAQDFSYEDCFSTKNLDDMSGIRYEIFQSNYLWIINKYLESKWLHSEYITEVASTDFQADRLLVQKFDDDSEVTYIAVYGKKVFILNVNEMPTKEQIEIFIKKLNLL